MSKHKYYCFDDNGKLIKEYKSTKELPKNFIIPNIHRSVVKGCKANGFYWSFSPTLSKKIVNEKNDYDNIMNQLKNKYTVDELKAIVSGHQITKNNIVFPKLNFTGNYIKFGVIGDTHIGSSYTSDSFLIEALKEFKKENVDFICHVGDVTEGMSNRPGHIYELSHLGYDAQKKHAINLLSTCDIPMYFIDGNHDRWYIKSNGALIVKDICDAIPNANYLGSDEGNIELNKNITIRLWHGDDGNSYATSYRIQKIVESLTGGEKPNMILFGHTHKEISLFERNIHCVSCGCLQKQTPFMRGKRIAAHVGFHIIELYISETGIRRCKIEWVPFYC